MKGLKKSGWFECVTSRNQFKKWTLAYLASNCAFLSSETVSYELAALQLPYCKLMTALGPSLAILTADSAAISRDPQANSSARPHNPSYEIQTCISSWERRGCYRHRPFLSAPYRACHRCHNSFLFNHSYKIQTHIIPPAHVVVVIHRLMPCQIGLPVLHI
jgi:hypothetical protein